MSGLILTMTPLSVATEDNVRSHDYGNDNIAEDFISAFYSWDATKLKNLMTENTDTVAILYYQRWAEAAN